ncbi:conjugative transposon protein TraM [Rudanella lutea]|uniref:conjugative transposon protein TraM n=1 Tax=Rudanella lutea TaxID=451374 RepID=UPI0003678298|nr:conjugative transposon protein TraM [Rudanella lutea]
MNRNDKDAHLDDNVFGKPGATPSTDDSPSDELTEEEFQDEEDEDDELAEEDNRSQPGNTEASAKRKRTLIVLSLGLLAMLGIGWFLWKMSFANNAFRAPVPAEPIDVAERESNRKQQPTDYADEEQMRTMDYGNVNSIYGLTLKRQEANRLNAAKDSARLGTSRLNPGVQNEIARSRQLSSQRTTYRSPALAGGSASQPRRYQSESYGSGSTYSGRSSTYGDPYHANPNRDDVLLRAGFNTVKAEGQNSNAYADARTLPPPSLASLETERSPVEENEPIPGVVSGDQTIMNGTRVMFRTLADAKIKDRFAPKGSILVGFAQVGGNRAVFNITTLRLPTGEAVPVRLRTLDMDMNEGLALQSDKPAKQQVDQASGSAISQAATQAAWSAGYGINQATRSAIAGNAIASLGAGLANAATTGRRREVRQKLNLQDGFKVFFVPHK